MDEPRAGASGFLLPDAAPRELVGAVRALAPGGAWLDPVVANALIREFAARPGPPAACHDGLVHPGTAPPTARPGISRRCPA